MSKRSAANMTTSHEQPVVDSTDPAAVSASEPVYVPVDAETMRLLVALGYGIQTLVYAVARHIMKDGVGCVVIDDVIYALKTAGVEAQPHTIRRHWLPKGNGVLWRQVGERAPDQERRVEIGTTSYFQNAKRALSPSLVPNIPYSNLSSGFCTATFIEKERFFNYQDIDVNGFGTVKPRLQGWADESALHS